MPTPTKGPRLGGSPAHERLMLANLATSLFTHGRITTTEAKAKRLRPFAERLITKARKADLHNRREIMRVIRDKGVVHRLIADIGPRFVDRPGGYTRIVKAMPRKGDNAPMAVIELVMESTATAEAEKARGSRFARGRSKDKDTKPDTPAPSAADAPATPTEQVAESATDQVAGSVEESTSTDDAPYGVGSHVALEDGTQPAGFPVKGDDQARQYHLPGSAGYADATAEVWFADADAAQAAGFTAAAAPQSDESES